jgi:hypothetical protein
MMKGVFVIILLFVSFRGIAQNAEVVGVMKSFHQAMIRQDSIGYFIHDSLTYGHSNGWIENAKEFRTDLGSIITYHSIKEDSIVVAATNKIAHIRFVADIDVSLRGKRTQFHLKILEVWVKEKKRWKLFARQAVK